MKCLSIRERGARVLAAVFSSSIFSISRVSPIRVFFSAGFLCSARNSSEECRFSSCGLVLFLGFLFVNISHEHCGFSWGPLFNAFFRWRVFSSDLMGLLLFRRRDGVKLFPLLALSLFSQLFFARFCALQELIVMTMSWWRKQIFFAFFPYLQTDQI